MTIRDHNRAGPRVPAPASSGASAPPGKRFPRRGRGASAAAALWLLAVALGALVRPIPAQAEQPADSTVAAQVLEVLRPSYSTTYNVNRQTTSWKQDFKFGTGFGFMNFNNRTRFEVKRDNGRDEERRDGSNQTDLRWFVIPSVPLHMNVNIGRRSVIRPGNENQTDETGLNLSGNYRWNLFGIHNSLDAGGGIKQRTDVSVRKELRSESVDSGLDGDLFWKASWSPVKMLSAETSVREKRSTKTITLRSEDKDTEEQPSSSRSRSFTTKVSFEPASWFKSGLTTSDVSGDDEYFLVTAGVGALEEKVSEKNSLTADLQFQPMENLDVSWRFTSDTHSLNYRVRSEIASSGSGNSWEGKIKTRLLGADIESKLSNSTDRLEPAISDTTNTEVAAFEGKLNRRLSGKFAVRFDWLVRANQIFFLTADPVDRLDRDELRTKVQPTLTYTPGRKWMVTTSYIRTTTRRIELNPTRATQTRQDEDFSVNFGITYHLSQATSISQNYSIQALYTTFDFTPKANRLLATQRIVSTVDSHITPKVELKMTHRFTLQDSGPFRLRPDGGRDFARNLRKYRQELASRVDYEVTPWFSLYVDSRFLRTDNVEEASGNRSVLRNLELKQGVSLVKRLKGGVDLTANSALVQSNVRDSYWMITSSLKKDF